MAISWGNKCDRRQIRGKEGRRWPYKRAIHAEKMCEETVLMCRSGRWSGKRNDSTDKE
jgi:hypothetical protein